ncbi:MAG: hypothetical protein Q4G14_04880 [Paracoccus sp. (in: a-proteobacteria)]|uniref:hypothetical protein n=1 Tax=Paracoccus sp. TaxID=267 RepID=UPI0026DFE60D|nr:hypothetical protein [Paracoccus sp. (in: a-proteobacteria)]MDO5612563.1 hypothetical protein [Paracoccus sp. (in: a-proteobacteria)]
MTQETTKKPILWLGAHKTGTTFLQNALEHSNDVLKKAGYCYMPLTKFRARYTRPLVYDGDHGQPHAPVPGMNLIFDENIPGLVQGALSPSGLYPQAAQRSQKVAQYFGLNAPDIWFGLRDYVSFLPSLFCETLKSISYQPFVRFYDPQNHPVNWVDLIGRLRLAFPASRICVYQNEALRGREAALLSAATGIPAADFTIPDGSERPGFSHRAVRSLYDLSKTRTVERRDVFAAVRQYPKGPKWPAFDPFNAARKQELSAAYQAHLHELRNLADVDFIDLAAG